MLSQTAAYFLIQGVASQQYGQEIVDAINASSVAASPGGPFNSIQYNQAGSFSGVPSFSFNGSSVIVALPFIVSGGHALVLKAITGIFTSFHTSTSQVGDLVYTMPLGAPLANTGYFLTSDTSGQWSWALAGGGSPAGSNQAVQYNNSGSFGGGSFSTDGDNVSIGNVSRFHFRSLANSNWVMGSDIGIITTPHLVSDVLSIVIDDNVGGGFAVGGATGQALLQINAQGNAWFNGFVDAAQLITPSITTDSGDLTITSNSGNVISNVNGMFNISKTGGGLLLTANASSYSVAIGDVSFPISQNGTQVGVADGAQTAYMTAPAGGGRISLQSGSSIESATTNSYIIKDNTGIEYLNINIAGGTYTFGNLSSGNYLSFTNSSNLLTIQAAGGVVLSAGLQGVWPVYADNVAAAAASLPIGAIYMASGSGANIQGTLMARY